MKFFLITLVRLFLNFPSRVPSPPRLFGFHSYQYWNFAMKKGHNLERSGFYYVRFLVLHTIKTVAKFVIILSSFLLRKSGILKHDLSAFELEFELKFYGIDAFKQKRLINYTQLFRHLNLSISVRESGEHLYGSNGIDVWCILIYGELGFQIEFETDKELITLNI